MFVDELKIQAKAGDGGDGVVRFRHEKHKPKGGPSGGNGGSGGNVYIRGVRDLSLLSKYTGSKEFRAGNGESGQKNSMHGHDGKDLYVDVPVGATVTDMTSGRQFAVDSEGEVHKILRGGQGGLGNEYFKSSTNQTPKEHTDGKKGESGPFLIELSLLVDVGLIGFPNAGKSTLLNTLTNATARVGSYPFTTVEPHLGDFYGFIIADVPGLIKGASKGKGLGHKFLKHVSRTKMLIHCISLENDDLEDAYQSIRNELRDFDEKLLEKKEFIVFTKSDLFSKEDVQKKTGIFLEKGIRSFVVSSETTNGIKELSDSLVQELRLAVSRGSTMP